MQRPVETPLWSEMKIYTVYINANNAIVGLIVSPTCFGGKINIGGMHVNVVFSCYAFCMIFSPTVEMLVVYWGSFFQLFHCRNSRGISCIFI